jgi:Mg2+-importing ATPase
MRKTTPAFGERPLAELLSELQTSPNGLDSAQANLRLQRSGPNVLQRTARQAWWWQLAQRFNNPLVLILLGASLVSAFLGELSSFVIISLIVLLSVAIDFVQEYRANQAVERLRQSVAVRATVLRDGRPQELPMRELVPGDVVLLAAGDLVPADGRLLQARDFFGNQELFTG